MANLSGIVGQLKKERDRVERQLSGLNAALAAFAEGYAGSNVPKARRHLSAKGRARIAAAQIERWAKIKGQSKAPKLGRRNRKRAGSPEIRGISYGVTVHR